MAVHLIRRPILSGGAGDYHVSAIVTYRRRLGTCSSLGFPETLLPLLRAYQDLRANILTLYFSSREIFLSC